MPAHASRPARAARPAVRGDTPAAPGVVAVLLAGVGVVLFGAVVGYRDVEVWGGLVLPFLLFAAIAPVAAAIERRQAVPMVGLVVGGLAARLVAVWVRFLVSFYVYDVSDAAEYHRQGSEIATRFHEGQLSLVGLIPRSTGTRFIDELTGLVEAIVGRSMVATYMVFASFSYLGALLMLHAARRAVPQLLSRRYAVLVFFLPSMLYWPSALGKDGPMQLAVGLAAFGASRLLAGIRSGWPVCAAGVYLAASIRPHVAVLLVAAVGLAFVSGAPVRVSALGPVPKVVGAVVLAVALAASLAKLGATFGEFRYSSPVTSANSVMTATENLTSTGGSELDEGRPTSPLGYPRAVFTVLFRPLIFEVNSATTAASALEGTVLLLLVWRWRANLRRGIGLIRSNRYVRFVVVYSVTFLLAWTSVNNLAIIARQRVMMLPLLLVLVCVAADAEAEREPV